MIIGHAMVGFTFSVLLADHLGIQRKRYISVGIMGLSFALLPDFDLALGLTGAIESGFSGLSQTREEFWEEGLRYHRGITHSLVFGFISATSFSLVSYKNKFKIIGSILALLIVIVSFLTIGLLNTITISFYMVPGLLIAFVAKEYGLDGIPVIISSFTGLLTHPLGDVFIGPSPDLLAPLPFELVSDQLRLFQDPTTHILSVFVLELVTVWVFIHVYLRINEDFILGYIRPYAFFGTFYGLISPFIKPPELGSADHIVITILMLCVTITLVRAFTFKYQGIWLGREVIKILLVSGVGIATVSVFSYIASYILILN